MPQVPLIVYEILTGDDTWPHSGDVTFGFAGTITIDDSDGTGDDRFGDDTHTGAADVPDQDISASSVAGINVGDTVDSRYQYTITGSDGSVGIVYFIATNELNNYGSLVVSTIPLDPSVTYTIGAFNTDGDVPYSDLVICFAAGTHIETDDGPIKVEELTIGQKVLTRDRDFQPIKWIGCKSLDAADLRAQPQLLPIKISKGSLGKNLPSSDLSISPQHRILVNSRIAKRMFDTDEVLIPANKLVELDGIEVAEDCLGVDYFHLLFDNHEIIYAENAPTESLYLGREALRSMSDAAKSELTTLFPELLTSDQSEPASVRMIPAKGMTMKKLVQRHKANNQPLM